MILIDKAREDFLKWKSSNNKISTIEIIDFRYLSQISKNALIIDFFDSVGIYINIRYNEVAKEFSYSLHFNPRQNDNHSKAIYKTRQEATKQAIIKANEIYNENK